MKALKVVFSILASLWIVWSIAAVLYLFHKPFQRWVNISAAEIGAPTNNKEAGGE